MDRTEIGRRLLELEEQLLSAPRHPVLLTPEWRNLYPRDPGVYLVFEDDGLVYAGETGSIRARMGDWFDSRNHVIRRNIGERHFSKVPGFVKASARVGFPADIEAMLETRIRERFKVAALPVHFGRVELEEHLVEKHGLTRHYNKRSRRA